MADGAERPPTLAELWERTRKLDPRTGKKRRSQWPYEAHAVRSSGSSSWVVPVAPPVRPPKGASKGATVCNTRWESQEDREAKRRREAEQMAAWSKEVSGK